MDRIGFGNFECLCWEEGLITGSWLCLWKMIRREVKRFAAFISYFYFVRDFTRCNFANLAEIYEWNRAEKRKNRCDLLKKEWGKVSII